MSEMQIEEQNKAMMGRMQAAFDKVWDWFVVQGKPISVTDHDNCKYRQDMTAECDVRCAMGVFLPDTLYRQNLEGLPAGTLLNPLSRISAETYDRAFLSELQAWADELAPTDLEKQFFVDLQHKHDDSRHDERYADRLYALALQYSLEAPEV